MSGARTVPLACAALAFLGCGAPHDVSDRPSPSAAAATAAPPCKVDLTAALAELGVPGASAGIVKRGRLVCASAAGAANIEERRPVTPDTVFLWASVSKTVTATAAMAFAADGKFGLDDDVNKYLPFTVRNPHPGCTADAITFRQLMTHTSSIVEDEFHGVYPSSYVVGRPPAPLGDFLKDYLTPAGANYSTANFKPECPQKDDAYSNVAIGLLGYAVERIAQEPFARVCKEKIFSPLGMDQTSFRLEGLDPSRLAMPYKGKSAATFAPVGQFEFATYPDGQLRTSVPQMARFLLMFMQFGEYGGTRILPRAAAEEMRRPQIPMLDDTQGLVWYYETLGGRRTLGHDGDDPGVSSSMYFDPTDDAGILLVANGQWDEDAAKALIVKLFDEATGY
jgi:CubicO group peptidase (beta-lactamase class C family)